MINVLEFLRVKPCLSPLPAILPNPQLTPGATAMSMTICKGGDRGSEEEGAAQPTLSVHCEPVL